MRVFKGRSQCNKIIRSLKKGRLEFFLFSSCLSSFSVSTHRSTFTMPTGGNAPRQDSQTLHGQNFKDLSVRTEKSYPPPVLRLLHELWLAHPPVVCVTFEKIIPPGGLVDATNQKSSHAVTPCFVCGSSSVSVLGC